MSNSQSCSFPRRVSAPGFLPLCFAHPNRGWRSAERRSGAAAPVGPADDAAGQAPSEAPCVPWRVKTRVNALMTRDARLSALHRGGFGLRGRASLTGICAGSVTASSSHPGHSAWTAGSRASRDGRLRAAAAGRHASLRLQDRLENAPSMSKAAHHLASLRNVVKKNSFCV
jgi:hypothetical protein